MPRIGETTRQQGPREVLLEWGAREGEGNEGGGGSSLRGSSATRRQRNTKLKNETRLIFLGEAERDSPSLPYQLPDPPSLAQGME